ncbi:PD40 domain-containing protein [Herbidospora cretacea]|uniref:PD40 domain-containing protein n=1 Tax=Herbidospora cretacea TaxID=28444 RepID=UPI0007742154|nr:PD40 domain-containing protein [Herbidospora cretacea]
MPPVEPLTSNDPASLGPYSLVGRLGGDVYLATAPGGGQVAARRLPRPLDGPGREALARVWEAAAVGTPHILDTGRDYIVSEYVPGPTLAEEVAGRGALPGPAVHRLAVTTATALASLHRAGLIHGAIAPERVLLGPDGPRLIGAERPVTPVWHAEERELWQDPDEPPSAAVDVFAWAAVIAFAATGRPPFGENPTRVSYGAADLGPLSGALRDLVADCLADEPQARPGAEETLLRLLGHAGALDSVLPTPPVVVAPQAGVSRTPPKERRRGGAAGLAAGGLALALVSGAGGYLLAPAPATQAARITPGAAPASHAPAFPSPGPSPMALAGGVLREEPGDPLRLASYQASVSPDATAAFTRSPNGAGFARTGGNRHVSVISPDGRWTATVDQLFVATKDRLDVEFTDRGSGRRFTVPTITAPLTAHHPAWSPDGTRLLLSLWITEGAAEDTAPYGFLLVDPATRAATVVETANDADREQFLAADATARLGALPAFRWTPDGRQVSTAYLTPEGRYGLRFHDLGGRVARSFHWVGLPAGSAYFSPDGQSFATTRCERRHVFCVWDTATGARRGGVPSSEGDGLVGWFDATHLMFSREKRGEYRADVIDFSGRTTRTLVELDVPGKDPTVQLFFLRG